MVGGRISAKRSSEVEPAISKALKFMPLFVANLAVRV
jgi:hypothetical protein